jgi:hypothetical protein
MAIGQTLRAESYLWLMNKFSNRIKYITDKILLYDNLLFRSLRHGIFSDNWALTYSKLTVLLSLT